MKRIILPITYAEKVRRASLQPWIKGYTTTDLKPPLNIIYCVNLQYPIWLFFREKNLNVVKNKFFTQTYLHTLRVEKWQRKGELSQEEESG